MQLTVGQRAGDDLGGRYTISWLKELEHRKLGWKVLILKYDLGKSLSKEMQSKMADAKKILTTNFCGQEKDFPS